MMRSYRTIRVSPSTFEELARKLPGDLAENVSLGGDQKYVQAILLGALAIVRDGLVEGPKMVVNE